MNKPANFDLEFFQGHVLEEIDEAGKAKKDFLELAGKVGGIPMASLSAPSILVTILSMPITLLTLYGEK